MTLPQPRSSLSDGESSFWTQLRWTNLAMPETEYQFAPPRRWRFDFAWPSQKIAVEIEGGTWIAGRHSRGTGYEADLEKYNEATAQGWQVYRVTTAMVDDGRALALAERVLQ